jgi:predicted nucleic acid-binding protein
VTGRRTVVLDASVGVKWFVAEAGSDRAYGLLEQCADGEIDMVVPVHFVHEVLAVVRRDFGPEGIVPAWEHMKGAGLQVVALTDDVVGEAAKQCEELACALYDALAPAVAALLGATLVSADAKAHRGVHGVELMGAEE